MHITSALFSSHRKWWNLIWCLSRSQSWPVGLSIQEEVMDVIQPAPQGAHYRTDVVNTNVFYSQKKTKAKLKGTILHNY